VILGCTQTSGLGTKMQNRIDTIIEGGYTVELPFVAYAGGKLHYVVNSEGKVDSFLLDAGAREAYRRGERFVSSTESEGETLVVGEFPLHPGGQWYFVIRNRAASPVRVQVALEFRIWETLILTRFPHPSP
jgi:hypothetical protein